jgi:signal peptidase I
MTTPSKPASSAPTAAETAGAPQGPDSQPQDERTPADTRWDRIADTLKTIGGAVLLALIIRTCVFEPFEIEGSSMEPSLLNGDRVVVAKFLYGLFLPLRDAAEFTWGGPDVGDIVILRSPADNVDIVKRVVGTAGDHVEMIDGQIIRNGKPLPHIDRGKCKAGTGAATPGCHVYESRIGEQTFFTSSSGRVQDLEPMDVLEGYVCVLGDHRDGSNDSRNPAVGMIPIERIKGHALAIYWSSGEDGIRWRRMFSAVR